MKEIKIIEHAYSRLPTETIKRIDGTKVEPRELPPLEKYFRNYKTEGKILFAIEKDPGFLSASDLFDIKITKAVENLKKNKVIEEETGFVHKISYNNLKDLFEKTAAGKIVMSVREVPDGLIENEISNNMGLPPYTHIKKDVDELLESGLLKKEKVYIGGKSS